MEERMSAQAKHSKSNQRFQSWGHKNANDTWHATKGVVKTLKCIMTGPKRIMARDGIPNLRTKQGNKTAMYHAMKNCEGS